LRSGKNIVNFWGENCVAENICGRLELNENWDGDKVKKRTIGNISSLSMDKVELIRQVLRGDSLVPVTDLFENTSSVHHGHIKAVQVAMKHLGMDKLIGSRPSRERDLALAMVAARILDPDSKLATTRWWRNTTIPEVFDVTGAGEDELYCAMDWLQARQVAIEKKLAARQGQGRFRDRRDGFDEKNLFEFTHPDYPGEQLIACKNHDKTGVRTGKVINKYKMSKHIELDIKDTFKSPAFTMDTIPSKEQQRAFDLLSTIRM
jgi:hypothetical protein